MADLVTTIKVDSKQFDNSIKNSTNQVRKFERDNYKAGQSVKEFEGRMSSMTRGALTGMLGTLGLAAGVAETFNRAIRGSQQTSDDFDVAIGQATTAVDYFFTAISTGNFENFFNGITSAIAYSKELTILLDALGDMKIADRFFKAEEQYTFDKNRAIINASDDKYTKEQKIAALEENKAIMEGMEARAKAIGDTSREAMIKAYQKATASVEDDYGEVISLVNIIVEVSSKEKSEEEKNALKGNLNNLVDTPEERAYKNMVELYKIVYTGTNEDYINYEKKVNKLEKELDNATTPTVKGGKSALRTQGFAQNN